MWNGSEDYNSKEEEEEEMSMGAWGEGMLDNDEAGDAVDVFFSEVERKQVKLIKASAKKVGRSEGNCHAILGIVEKMMDLEMDMKKGTKDLARRCVKIEMRKDNLEMWKSPAARKSALKDFQKRLDKYW